MFQATTDTASLLNAVKMLNTVAGGKFAPPGFYMIKITKHQYVLTLEANNPDVQLALDINSRNGIDGETVVAASDLLAAVSVVRSNEIDLTEIENTKDERELGYLRISSYLGYQDIQLSDHTIFPDPKDLGELRLGYCPKDTLLQDLKFVRPCIPREEIRYFLLGACIDLDGQHQTIVATDGKRMAMRSSVACTEKVQAIVPTATVDLLLKHKPAIDIIRIYRRGIVFMGQGYSLASTLIDGIFPDYKRAIGKFKHNALVPTKDLLQILGPVPKQSRDEIKKGFLSHTTLNFSNEQLTVNGQSIWTSYNRPDLAIHFATKYLAEAIKSCQSSRVFLEFTDKTSQLRITDEISRGEIIVMPIRID